MKNTPAKSAAAKRAAFSNQRAAFSATRRVSPTFFDPVWQKSMYAPVHKVVCAENKREKKVWRDI